MNIMDECNGTTSDQITSILHGHAFIPISIVWLAYCWELGLHKLDVL